MIYLASKKSDKYINHEFYHDGFLYFHCNSEGKSNLLFMEYGRFDLKNGGSYRLCERFEYELPETLKYIGYTGMQERVDMLENIVEHKIFDKL